MTKYGFFSIHYTLEGFDYAQKISPFLFEARAFGNQRELEDQALSLWKKGEKSAVCREGRALVF